MSAVELMRKRNEMIETAKQEISDIALNLLAQPQQQIDRLRVLIGLCKGERIHSLIRETVQKLAIASTVEVFVDIIPGYAIRPLSEEEKSQKMKKETKKLHDYENTLLNYYNKYLQVIEKNVTSEWICCLFHSFDCYSCVLFLILQFCSCNSNAF
ncbi:unnamed protein product [Anisakis simplex]|uniref:Nucleolar complex-associated protein 3 N-terminal domain-containing protein n=1 Tax=Anisakis simplex TaxID=6269 RepID=A0A3P6N1W2_ANISI|nr:unnamed protein product [Anisakis simplex]